MAALKESMGIKDLQEMRSNLTGMDLFTDLAERVSASMTNKKATGHVSIPIEDSVQGRASFPTQPSIPVGGGRELGKESKVGRVKRRDTKRKCPILRMNLYP